MRQPLLPVALGYVTGVVVAAWWPVPLAVSLAASFVFLVAAVALYRWRSFLLWPLLVAAGTASLTLRTAVLAPHDLRRVAGESAQIVSLRGAVEGDPSLREPSAGREGKPHTLAVIAVEELLADGGSRPAVGRVVVNTRGALASTIHAGRRVEVEGVLATPEGPRAPGLFDYRAYLRGQGIHHQLRVRSSADWRVLEPDSTPPLATRFLSWAQTTLALGLPQEDEPLRLLWAMTLGWRTALTDEVAEPFMRTGTMIDFVFSTTGEAPAKRPLFPAPVAVFRPVSHDHPDSPGLVHRPIQVPAIFRGFHVGTVCANTANEPRGLWF